MIAPVVSTHRGQQVKTGRKHVSAPVVGPRRMMAHMLLESLPPPPDEVDWLKAAKAQAPNGDLGMMLNDQLGICTKAAVGHAIQIWSANTGTMITPPDSEILKAYERVDGYIPGRPDTDQGGVEVDSLGDWQRNGVAGVQIDAWVPVNWANTDHVRKAIYHFGLVYIGLALPLTTEDQAGDWTLDIGAADRADAGSRGGHAVIVPKYSPSRWGMVTWGDEQGESLDFAYSYTDECYAPFCKALWCRNGNSPLGESAQALLTAMQAVA